MNNEKSFCFIHCSDSHIGIDCNKSNYKDKWNRSKDFIRNLDVILDRARDPKVDFFIHAGDIFDRKVSSIPKSIVNETMEKFYRLGKLKPVFLLPGNHEKSCVTKGLCEYYSNLFIFNKPSMVNLELNNCILGISGFPYIRKNVQKRFNNVIKKIRPVTDKNDYNILILHQLIESAVVGYHNYSFNAKNSSVIKVNQFPLYYDYIAAGHVHKQQQIKNHTHNDQKIYYSGSIERTSSVEYKEQKGFILVNTTINQSLNGKKTEITFINLPTKTILKLEISINEFTSKDDFFKKIERNLKNLMNENLIFIRVIGIIQLKLWQNLQQKIYEWLADPRIRYMKIYTTNQSLYPIIAF